MDDLKINVGIPTLGKPLTEKRGEYTLLRNMLIGKDFHWQREIEVLLPGEIDKDESSCEPEFTLINRLPLETYLECVIGSEMNPDAPLEFLKAHAVISRSWALGKIKRNRQEVERKASDKSEGKVNGAEVIINWEDSADHHGFDVCSDDHCQRYQGVQPIHEKIKEAIRATRGLVLYSPEGTLVDARFSKCCGGRTEIFSSCWQPRPEPCLESFEDPWCDLSGLEPPEKDNLLRTILKDYDLLNGGGYSWETSVTAEEIRQNFQKKFGRDIGEITGVDIVERGASGRVTRIRLTGSEGKIEIGKELMIRRLLAPTHLYSSWIEIQRLPSQSGIDRYHIKGRGWGHGVGLCQIGAARMAFEGYGFREILSFYYPGSILAPLQRLK